MLPAYLENESQNMKLKTLFSIAIGFACVYGVQATTYKFADADSIGVDIKAGEIWKLGKFDIVNSDGTESFKVEGYPDDDTDQYHNGVTYTSKLGFDPLLMKIIKGNISFWFQDANKDAFTISVDLNEMLFDVGTAHGTYVYQTTSLDMDLIVDLQEDGIITYSVDNKSASGITFDYALLSATAVPDTASSMILLGSALSGFAMLRRKRS